jgi:Skp family chaperone for outer membrane proteins
MKPLKTVLATAVFVLMLTATQGFAQGTQPPPTQPPATQPPATQPPATAQPPAPAKPAAPVPFPEGSKVGYVSIQFVASNSVEGKAATARIDELRKKKTAELAEKNKALEAANKKLTDGRSVMNASAIAQMEKEIDKMNRDLQFSTQEAQTEVNELTEQLQSDFQQRMFPIIEQVRAEKGLHMIFAIPEAGIVAADPGLDLSNEVVKRFDAAKTTAPKK